MPIDKKGETDSLKRTNHKPCKLCTTAAKTGGEAVESRRFSGKSLVFFYFFLAGGIFFKIFPSYPHQNRLHLVLSQWAFHLFFFFYPYLSTSDGFGV